MKKAKYLYVFITYDDDDLKKEYTYRSEIEGIKKGDKVLIDRNGNETIGTVSRVNLYSEQSVPYPINKTKEIIKVIENNGCFDDESSIIKDYNNLLLNNMFGLISIKRLMKLNKLTNEIDNNKLFYYPKFNTFYYKTNEGKYNLAEYNTKLISDEMFRIIEKESIEVQRYNIADDETSYIKAVEYCQKNGLSYHDDTNFFDFTDVKKELNKNKTKTKEPKPFDSIEEIKNYLKKEYKPAYWKTPKPSYYINNGVIIHYMGWLQYDMRVFEIFNFLIDNKYIDEKYYDEEKYPMFFDEDWHEYDYENLDIGRVSYMLLRILNIERISEGTINEMVNSGIMLKLIERAQYLKEDDKDD